MATTWPTEIDGLGVLRRIRSDRGRVTLQRINDSMAEAALSAALRLLREQHMTDDAKNELTTLAHHISRVISARRKVRG